MLGCYRAGDAHDPKVYVTAVIAVLSDYTQDIVDRVTDPRDGIPSKIKWLPTIAEIKGACEQIAGPRRRNAEWNEQSQRQLAERKALEDRRPKQTYEEFKAEMAARGMPVNGTRTMAATHTVEDLKHLGNLSDAQWDALPNTDAGTTPRSAPDRLR